MALTPGAPLQAPAGLAAADERATGSLGPRAEGAAAARRWLPRSHGGRPGKAAGAEAGLRGGPLPGPGAGRAPLSGGLPHRRRRRRLRCGSKLNMAAAALRTRGPGGRASGPRAHCALGRGSAVLGRRRRRRPGDMAGAEEAAAAAAARGAGR